MLAPSRNVSRGPHMARFNYPDGMVNSNYNALSAKVTRRLSHGLTLLAAFTWSHSLDDGSGPRTAYSQLPKNTYNVHDENYAVSNFDQQRRFVSLGGLPVAVGKGQKLLNHGGVVDAVLGGWQLGSIVALMDGFPVTQAGSGDSDSLNQNANSCNATGISPLPAPSNSTNVLEHRGIQLCGSGLCITAWVTSA